MTQYPSLGADMAGPYQAVDPDGAVEVMRIELTTSTLRT